MNRAILRMKSSVVSAAAICVSLFLLSIIGYSALPNAPSDYGQPLPGIPASTSSAATPPTLACRTDRPGYVLRQGGAGFNAQRQATWRRILPCICSCTGCGIKPPPVTPGSSTCPERP
jgi:hypothetical protein